MEKKVRALRGAITANSNSKESIIESTELLLSQCLSRNSIDVNDIVSILFSMTSDLNAEFPAAAARKIGLSTTPLLCTREISVPGSVEKCIRVLIHFYSQVKEEELHHIYLREAKQLRMDLPE